MIHVEPFEPIAAPNDQAEMQLLLAARRMRSAMDSLKDRPQLQRRVFELHIRVCEIVNELKP